MGRAPCCDKANVKKGPWSPEEDAKLKDYIEKTGTGGNWIALPQKAGLRRCGKSCRLRWLNYLRPNIKHGDFSDEEDMIICSLYASIGSRWSLIAAKLPGRTDNDIKNYWNTKLKKKIMLGLVSSSPYKKPNPPQTTTYPPSISFLQTPFPSHQNTTYYNYTTNSQANSFMGQPSFRNIINNSPNPSSLLGFVVEGSCSSSDESCITNQIGRHHLQNYFYHNGVDENHSNFLITNGVISEYDQNGHEDHDQKPTVISGSYDDDNPLDYNSLEEIKHLISTNFCANSLNLLLDENKAEDKVL